MCGITGFVDFSRASSESILKEMTSTLKHRGPDASGTYFAEKQSYNIGFGHQRLSILELSELGKQPMHWNDYVIVFNGEIYNFKEIKNELVSLGHAFQAESDTEMILHAYAQWGISCLENFIGMFAFVIYNKQTGELVIARDRTGIKPLFMYFSDQHFLFASELKAFHKHPSFKKELNIPALQAYFQFGSVPTPHCIFEHCIKLKPGHYIQTNTANFEITQKQYWNVYDFYNKPKFEINEREAIQETEKLLISASEYRMISDVPVGVFLSGGYDSTLVTSLLQQSRIEKLKTFTISVPDIGLNEALYAKEIAKHLGTDHTEIACSAKDAIEIIPELPFYFDEPFADSSSLPTLLVSRMAKKEVTVALSADGGDEVFAGYNRYEMMAKFDKKIHALPSFAQKGISRMMHLVPADKIPYFKHKYNFSHRYEKIKSLLADYNKNQLMYSLSKLFTDAQINQLFNQPLQKIDTYYESTELTNYSLLAYAQAIDYQTYLLDDILQKVDRASMAASLESREPLLDHRLIEFAAQLPDSMKYRQGEKKWILKEIVHQYIPKTLMDRPKMGFAIPIENWLKNELRDLVEETISFDNLSKIDYLNATEVLKIKAEFYSGRKELGVKLWYILCFLLWNKKWNLD